MFDIVPSLPKKVENTIDKTQNLENRLKLLEEKTENIENMTNDHQNKIKNIGAKVQDLNILELFKTREGENGEDSNMLYILANLEKFKAGCKRVLYSVFSLEAADRIRNGIDFTHRTFMGFISASSWIRRSSA